MIHRTVSVWRLLAVGLAMAFASAVAAAGQTRAAAPEKMPAWTHPKTPWGNRDLLGMWPSADTIDYEATVDDSTIVTRTWKVALPLRCNPDCRIYEYACHDGNYKLLNFIRGSLFQRAQKPKQ